MKFEKRNGVVGRDVAVCCKMREFSVWKLLFGQAGAIGRPTDLILLGLILLIFFPVTVEAQNKSINRYIGLNACKSCHPAQHENYQKYARKSRSFKSVEKMKKGLTPDEINGCYHCHTTGHGQPGGFVSIEQTPDLKNAGCEVCHGPGMHHAEDGDPDLIVREVTLDICKRCHTEDRVQSFRYKPVIYAGSH
ncbi:MAG: cytochrome c family protein [Desulfobulbaceae bacterium]|nr:cytochrome c family protein [Desulfobulbaceae bacterium]MCK5543980.1 cytochrome c family protein [Desulfobulbaceae bacterium]